MRNFAHHYMKGDPAPTKQGCAVAPKCAVRGVIRPGAMCGAVIVGGESCGFKGKCEHQRTPGVKVEGKTE